MSSTSSILVITWSSSDDCIEMAISEFISAGQAASDAEQDYLETVDRVCSGNGIPEAARRFEAALDRRDAAIETLGRATPASLAGAHLLAQFVAQSFRQGNPPESYGVAVASLERALAKLAHNDLPFTLQS